MSLHHLLIPLSLYFLDLTYLQSWKSGLALSFDVPLILFHGSAVLRFKHDKHEDYIKVVEHVGQDCISLWRNGLSLMYPFWRNIHQTALAPPVVLWLDQAKPCCYWITMCTRNALLRIVPCLQCNKHSDRSTAGQWCTGRHKNYWPVKSTGALNQVCGVESCDIMVCVF